MKSVFVLARVALLQGHRKFTRRRTKESVVGISHSRLVYIARARNEGAVEKGRVTFSARRFPCTCFAHCGAMKRLAKDPPPPPPPQHDALSVYLHLPRPVYACGLHQGYTHQQISVGQLRKVVIYFTQISQQQKHVRKERKGSMILLYCSFGLLNKAGD